MEIQDFWEQSQDFGGATPPIVTGSGGGEARGYLQGGGGAYVHIYRDSFGGEKGNSQQSAFVPGREFPAGIPWKNLFLKGGRGRGDSSPSPPSRVKGGQSLGRKKGKINWELMGN